MKKNLQTVLCLFALFKISEVISDPLSGIEYKSSSEITSPYLPKRIEFQTVTVDNFEVAQSFYIDVLGSIPLDEEPIYYNGDNHMNALFTKSDKEYPYPDLVNDFQVKSQFVVLGNGLIQILQFVPLEKNNKAWTCNEKMTAPTWIGAAHIDFWIDDDVDMNDYIEAMEKACTEKKIANVQFNRPVLQETRKDRGKVSKNRYANKVPVDIGGAFGGLEWSYFKGPVIEQLELYRMIHTMKNHISTAYRSMRNVDIEGFVAKKARATKPLTQQLVGIFQHGFRTNNLHTSVGFYTQVLGGDLISYPVHGMDIRGDDAHWMIFANETIEAYEYALEQKIAREEAMREFGVANISSSGNYRLDHRFILFDNFVVEPLYYTKGKAFGGESFNPTWEHTTSPAYRGSISVAFGVHEKNWGEMMNFLKERGIEQGYTDVLVEFPSTSATFDVGHPYHGLEYAYGKGPSGEAINFVTISGSFRERLEKALVKSGATSTAFKSTAKSLECQAK